MGQEPKVRLKLNTWLLPPLLGLLLLAWLVDPHKGWMALLLGLGGAWLISYLWARSLARGLRLTREVRFGWVQVGDRLEERFTLADSGLVPALGVEIVDHSTVPGYKVGRAVGVDGSSSTRWRKEAVCTRRGVFALGPTSLLTSDPFGLYTVSLHYRASMPFVVMPPILPLPAIDVAAGGRADGRPRPHASGRTVSASSVREYAPGDSLRWIHWRTSARRDSLTAWGHAVRVRHGFRILGGAFGAGDRTGWVVGADHP